MTPNPHSETNMQPIDALLNGLEDLARNPNAGLAVWHQIVDVLGLILPAKSIAIYFQIRTIPLMVASKGAIDDMVLKPDFPQSQQYKRGTVLEVPCEKGTIYWVSLSDVFDWPQLMLRFDDKLVGMERESLKSLLAAISEIAQIALHQNSFAVLGGVSRKATHSMLELSKLQALESFHKFLAERIAEISNSPRVSLCLLHSGRSRLQATNQNVPIDHASETVLAICNLATESAKQGGIQFGLVSNANSERILPYFLCFPWSLNMDREPESSVVLEFESEAQLGHALYPLVSFLSLIETTYFERMRWAQIPRWLSGIAQNRIYLSWFRSRLLTFLGILVGVGAAYLLMQTPYPFKIQGRGILETVDRRGVFSVADGTINRLHVGDRQHVRTGDVLTQIVSPALELQIEEVTGLIQALLEKQNSIAILLSQLSSDAPEYITSQSKLTSEGILTAKELEHAQAKRRFLVEEKSRYELRAPIDGMIIAPQADKNLLSRPVRRGDKLMEIAAVDGPWQLNCLIEDRDTQHFLRASRENSQQVEILFDNLPNQKFAGEVIYVSERLESIPGKGNCMRVYLRVSQDLAAENFIGAQASVYFRCGTMPIWYVWLRPIADSARRLWSLHQ